MAGIIRTPVKVQIGQVLDRRGARGLISLILAMLAGVLSGCAPARLDKVIIHERLARSGEYQVIQVVREDQPVAVSESMDLKPGDELVSIRKAPLRKYRRLVKIVIWVVLTFTWTGRVTRVIYSYAD